MENRSHALVAGLFLVLLGAMALGALWWFSGRSEETLRYVVETRGNVTGLNVQAQVRYRGIRVGKVESIRLDPADARVTLVGIAVRQDIPVTRSTTATLGYQGVTGIAHILLEAEGEDTTPLAPGEKGAVRIVMQDSLVQELAETGSETLEQARLLLANLNDLLRPENRRSIARTLAHVEESAQRARDTAAQLQQLLSPTNVQRVGAVLGGAERTVAQAGPFFAEARGLVTRLQDATGRVEAALGDPASGGVGALAPRLNELSEELTATTRQLNRVLRVVEETPQSLVFGRQDRAPGPGENGFVAPTPSKETP